MSKPKTISVDNVDNVDNVEYVRTEDFNPVVIGEKRIIVAERGWVFVGDCVDEENGSVTINNAKNIRRWGTSKGLGEIASGPTSNTKTDDYGTVNTVALVTIAVTGGW